MLTTGMYVTTLTAQEVANTLNYVWNDASPSTFFRLDITDMQGTERLTYWVRPRQEEPVTTASNGDEITHCISREGVRIDINTRGRRLRDTRPAGVTIHTS